MVELKGRIGVNAYKTGDGEAKAALTFHVNNIKLHGSATPKTETPVTANATTIKEPVDDLPF